MMIKLLSGIGIALSLGIGCAYADSPAQINSSVATDYIANFAPRTGQHPVSQPTLASDGNYYGVLPDGALNDAGSIYKLTPDGIVTVLHKFKGDDGKTPMGRLLQASDGALYGTTYAGGSKSCGIVFRISLSSEFHVLHEFNCRGGGGNPAGGVIQASDGQLYGTAQTGGRRRDGVVYSLSLAGEYSVVGDMYDQYIGAKPIGELLQMKDGGFLGIASKGVGQQGGTLFSVSPAGLLDREFAFLQGDEPNGGLVFSPQKDQVYITLGKGAIYTYHVSKGGIDRLATVDFGSPSGGLTPNSDGSSYYGFCSRKGGHGCTYSMTPDGKLSYLTGTLKGMPIGSPTFSLSGQIVGTTQSGGNTDSGAAFEMSLQ